MPVRRLPVAIGLVFILSWTGIEAHQDPCHRRHSCPSDHGTYVCGDRGRCEQCPDHQYCRAGKPRAATSPSATPTSPASTPTRSFTPEGVTVCFRPGGNCTEQIVKTLEEAQRSILVQAYSFPSATIAKALRNAHRRGLQVQVLLDKSQCTEPYSSADFRANQAVSTKIDAQHAIAHNKIIMIDGETIITGSFHFTKAAQEKNAENVLIIKDKALAAQDMQNWQAHAQHSQPYVGRGVR